MNKQNLISRLHETSQALEQLAQHLSEIELVPTEDKASEAAEPAEETAHEIEIEIEKNPEPEEGIIIETTFEPIIDKEQYEKQYEEQYEEPSKEPDEEQDKNSDKESGKISGEEKKSAQAGPKQNFNQNNNPFAKIINNLLSKPLPNPSNIGGLNPLQMLAGNFSGFNTQSLPTTLAELHDNPQLLGMIKNVSNNPQMLNMLSTITGQDAQTLQQTLESLQPTPINVNPMSTENSPLTNPLNSAPEVSTVSAVPNPAIPVENTPATPYLDSLLAEWHWQPYARAWDF